MLMHFWEIKTLLRITFCSSFVEIYNRLIAMKGRK